MAVRYSGDAEVRVLWDPKRRMFLGRVRDPYVRWRGTAPRPTQARGRRQLHRASESYDLMATIFLRRAQTWARETHDHELQIEEERGRLKIRRVFQAPCPTETCAKRGRKKTP